MEDFERRLREGDTSLFAAVPSQTTEGDKASLLLLHNACRELHGTFRYLEIGSHIGGSMQVMLADERCLSVTSIDSRPAVQPDSSMGPVPYPDNTVERMLAHLEQVPGADLGKLTTITATTAEIEPDGLAADLCLIDGEHTHEAALRDAHFCQAVLGDRGAIVFHDRQRTRAAIREFFEALPGSRIHILPDSVAVIELGPPWLELGDG